MGDGSAVDIAEESHRGVLAAAGALRFSEDMIYRQLFPLSSTGYVEGVMIDDHVGCQLGPADKSWREHGAGRDKDVFEAADLAYARVGLEGNEKKTGPEISRMYHLGRGNGGRRWMGRLAENEACISYDHHWAAGCWRDLHGGDCGNGQRCLGVCSYISTLDVFAYVPCLSLLFTRRLAEQCLQTWHLVPKRVAVA